MTAHHFKYLFVLIASITFFAGASMADNNEISTSPEQVVSGLIIAMENNDSETIRSIFSENASQAYGTGRPKSGEAFRAWLESDIVEVGGRVNDAQFSVDGNEVVVTGQYQNNNGYSSAANFLMVVEDGKIVSWTMRY